MKIKLKLILLFCIATIQIYSKSSIPENVQTLMQQLTIEEKIDLLCAKAPKIERLGIIQYDWWSECLHGVARAGKATVFPKPIAMGSTWDVDLIKRVGIAISDEARAKHHKALQEKGYSDIHYGLTFFSPTLNIARDPRWGRTSECFSEDPLITSEMGVAFIQGMQGDDPYYLKLVATAKHFVANNEEDRRLGGSSSVDETSLREYYFPAFQAAITKGKATSVMGAYNALNGVPCCANPWLLTDVLRNEWGFEGVVISDGSAIDKLYTHHKYVTSKEEGAALAVKAGCDMSLRDEYRPGLRKAYKDGLINESEINKAVERVLMLRVRLGIDDPSTKNPYTKIPYSVVENVEHRQLAQEAAEKSIVLLKNEENILPLKLDNKKKLKIGLIGDAFQSVYYGDYSGTPDFNATLFDCLTTDVGKLADISFVNERKVKELIPANYLTRSANQAYDGILGFTGEYYNNKQGTGEAMLVRQDLNLNFTPNKDEQLKGSSQLSARWSSTLEAPITGKYLFTFDGSGKVKMRINNKEVLKKSSSWKIHESFEIELREGEKYPIEIEAIDINVDCPFNLTWRPPFNETDDTPEKIAERSDVVILFLRDDNSSEGRDRKNLLMNPAQVELIDKITRINPNTVLILGSGSTLTLTNIVNKPKALLNVWIAGQGEAQAISNVLLGKVNPSGKTAVTFFANESQLPPMDDYSVINGRSYQYFKGVVLYPFGYGLSYTTYQYSSPILDKRSMSAGQPLSVSVAVKNTGSYGGEEIVQCYLSSPDWEQKGLKQKLIGYKRVFLNKGETRHVTFNISEEDLQRWDTKKKVWSVMADKYEVLIVPHSGMRNAMSFNYTGK